MRDMSNMHNISRCTNDQTVLIRQGMLANVLANFKHQFSEYKIRNFQADCCIHIPIEIAEILIAGKRN
jgi:hypothetical protein